MYKVLKTQVDDFYNLDYFQGCQYFSYRELSEDTSFNKVYSNFYEYFNIKISRTFVYNGILLIGNFYNLKNKNTCFNIIIEPTSVLDVDWETGDIRVLSTTDLQEEFPDYMYETLDAVFA